MSWRAARLPSELTNSKHDYALFTRPKNDLLSYDFPWPLLGELFFSPSNLFFQSSSNQKGGWGAKAFFSPFLILLSSHRSMCSAHNSTAYLTSIFPWDGVVVKEKCQRSSVSYRSVSSVLDFRSTLPRSCLSIFRWQTSERDTGTMLFANKKKISCHFVSRRVDGVVRQSSCRR